MLQINISSFPGYFSNLECSALFHPQDKQKVEYLKPTTSGS